MELDEYVRDATLTDLMDYAPVIERLKDIKTLRLLHAAMGLCTEAGEFMDMLKKHILYGRPLDTVNLKEELGDSQWYAALAVDALEAKFVDILEKNILKLRARYPNKFNEEDASRRNLREERRILEVGE